MQKHVALMLLFAVATLVIAIDGVLRPERKYFSLVFFVVGLVGTWRQYLAWRRDRSRADSRADTHPT